MIDILYYIFILIAGFAFAIVGIAVLILTPYVAYKRLTAPMPLKKEPIDLNFQKTPKLQQAYEENDWDAYDALMGAYLLEQENKRNIPVHEIERSAEWEYDYNSPFEPGGVDKILV